MPQIVAEVAEKPHTSHGNRSATSELPFDDYHLHICAFHIAKDKPNFVIETQLYEGSLRYLPFC
ncbi:MAG: hypothetical protein H0V82_12265 [Candidatus Protochlamydia sp.]|nr:hypothetical protein [Candidatus Protochlamydia sp.]